MFTPFNRIITLLKLYLIEEEKAICMKMFLAALFIIIKELKARKMSGLGKFQLVSSMLVRAELLKSHYEDNAAS